MRKANILFIGFKMHKLEQQIDNELTKIRQLRRVRTSVIDLEYKHIAVLDDLEDQLIQKRELLETNWKNIGKHYGLR